MVQAIDHGLALLSPGQMAEADQLTIAAGTSGFQLMERAAYALADDIAARHGQGTRVAIACGPGNNGGDGLVLGRILMERGFIVRVGLLGDASALTGDAAQAAKAFRGTLEPAGAGLFERASLIVDALFGAGLSRPVEGEAADLIAAINAARATGVTVLAVDLPSGIDGATGAVLGAAVTADRTVTFFRAKPGHVLMPGRSHTGKLVVADIGIRDRVLKEIGVSVFRNGPALWREDWPTATGNDHKYSRGAALIASGPVTSSGAARLAGEAALRSGAGMVTIAAPPEAVPVIAAYRAAFVVRPLAYARAFASILEDTRLKAALIGPGLGLVPATAAMTEAALESGAGLVIDADAITLAAENPAAFFEAIKARSAPVVLTPHEGEFARLFPDVTGPKLDRALEAAELSGAVVVLKGPDSVIAHPDGRAIINDNAPADLATAGSGDVLAGIITGLLAQGRDGLTAAALGVWIHGRAGTLAGPGLIADDLANAVRDVMREGCPEG